MFKQIKTFYGFLAKKKTGDGSLVQNSRMTGNLKNPNLEDLKILYEFFQIFSKTSIHGKSTAYR